MSSQSPKKRELSHDHKGLLAWVICFSTYAAIITKKQPEKTQQLLAYQATIVRGALRFDCKGWIGYDNMFRQQVAKSTKCMSPDHQDADCALNSLEDSHFSPVAHPLQTPGIKQ